MSDLAQKLAGTRQLLDPILGASKRLGACALGHAGADAALRGGIARGALHEVFAGDASATGFALGLAQRVRAKKKLLWIRQDFSALEHGEISSTGLAELGIDPSCVLLLRAAHAEDALRAGADALSCPALGAVIVEIPGNPKVLDLVTSRRLVLGAQAKGITVILLRPTAQAEPSAADTRWLIHSSPSAETDEWGEPRFDAALTRNRQGETGRWVMEWSCDDGAFRQPAEKAAHPRPVAAAPADRPPAQGEVRLAG